MLNTILGFMRINIICLSILSGVSILPLTLILIASFVFNFCLYHRIFLYYIAISDIINWIDHSLMIPTDVYYLLAMHIILAGITIVIAIISYVKDNKKLITSSHR